MSLELLSVFCERVSTETPHDSFILNPKLCSDRSMLIADSLTILGRGIIELVECFLARLNHVNQSRAMLISHPCCDSLIFSL